MSDRSRDAIELARAEQELRQEQDTFEQKKHQENRWFRLRLTVGYGSIGLISAIMCICSYILFQNALFPNTVVISAGGVMFGDVLGLVVAVWKIVLNPNSFASLQPVTRTSTVPGQVRPARSQGRSDRPRSHEPGRRDQAIIPDGK